MNFGSWFQTWLNVLTQPGEPVFEVERAKPEANFTTAAIWIALVSLVAGIFSLIQGAIAMRQLQAMGGLQGMLSSMNLPPEVTAQLDQLPAGLIPGMGRASLGIGSLISAVIGAIIAFVIFAGLLQLVAKILGGTGSFSKYTYLLAAIYVPITAISSVLAVIPVVGWCVGPLLWIYQIVLAYFATRVEHKLSSGRSIIVVLAPVIIGLIVACCFISVIGGIVGAVINSGQ